MVSVMPPCFGGPIGPHQGAQTTLIHPYPDGNLAGYMARMSSGVMTRGKAMSNCVISQPPENRGGGKGKNMSNGKVVKPGGKRIQSGGKNPGKSMSSVGKRVSGKGKGAQGIKVAAKPTPPRSRGKNIANLRKASSMAVTSMSRGKVMPSAVKREPKAALAASGISLDLCNRLPYNPPHSDIHYPIYHEQGVFPQPLHAAPGSLGSLHEHCRVKAREALGLASDCCFPNAFPPWNSGFPGQQRAQQYHLRSRVGQQPAVNPSRGNGGPPIVRTRPIASSCPPDQQLSLDCSVEYDMPSHLASDLASSRRRDPLLIIHPEWQRRVTRSARSQPQPWWQPRVPVSYPVPVPRQLMRPCNPHFQGIPCSQCPPFLPPQTHNQVGSFPDSRKRSFSTFMGPPETRPPMPNNMTGTYLSASSRHFSHPSVHEAKRTKYSIPGHHPVATASGTRWLPPHCCLPPHQQQHPQQHPALKQQLKDVQGMQLRNGNQVFAPPAAFPVAHSTAYPSFGNNNDHQCWCQECYFHRSNQAAIGIRYRSV